MVVGALLAALVAWLPWPFGGVVPGVVALAGAGAAALVALAAVGSTRLSPERALRPFRAVALPAAALLGLALLGWFQALPLPAGVVSVLSPDRVERSREAGAALAALEGASEETAAAPTDPAEAPRQTLPLSYAPEASRRSGLWFAALAAVFLTAALVGGDRKVRRLLAAVFVVTACAQVVVGARRWLSRADSLWGIPIPNDPGRLRGTFVNPDHAALYFEIALAVVFAWGWWVLGRARQEAKVERRALLVAPPAVAWGLLFTGVAFTGSRAALVAAVLGALAQGFLAVRAAHPPAQPSEAPRLRRGVLAGVLAVVLGLALVGSFGVERGFGRFAGAGPADASWADRLAVYRGMPQLMADCPWLGCGLGSFRESFPRVQPDELASAWRHAHSDWLELVVTAGLVGVVLVGMGLFALVRRLFDRLGAGLRSEDRAAPLAALGALVTVGLHELVDFGLTMPASSVALAVLCGAAAAAHGGRRRSSA